MCQPPRALAPPRAASRPERQGLPGAPSRAGSARDRRAVPALPGGDQPLEKRRGSPARAMRRGKPLHRLHHGRQSRLLRPVHRTSAPRGEAVAVDIYDVDIAGAQGDSFLEDLRALVDERMQQPIEDLFIGDGTALDPELARDLLDEGDDCRVADASASLVAVEALAGFLAEPAIGDQPLENRREALIGREPAPLADEEADIVAGKVAYRERSHGETEALHHPIDLLGCRALLQQELGLRAVVHQHAVADEAVAVAGEHRNLSERLAESHDGCDRLRRARGPAHVLQQLHDVRGTEEMRANHLLRTRGAGGDRIDVEGRGVGGENGVRGGHAIELGEDLFLNLHILEHRLDDDVRRVELAIIAGPLDEGAGPIGPLGWHAAARHRSRIIPGDYAESALQRFGRELEQPHRDAGVREIHGNTAAHRARTDHRGAAHSQGLYLRTDAGDLARLALGEEHVRERAALRAVAALDEMLALDPQRLGLRARACRLDAVDDLPGRELTARTGDDLLPERGEELRGHALDTRAHLARETQGPALKCRLACKRHGRTQRIVVDRIDEPQLESAR